jgi:CRISPR-associated endonuclease Cas1
VIVLGAGVVTTEAMLWCHARNLPLVVARTATPTMVNAVALFDHAGLRRAQALAPFVKGPEGRTVALGVARWLIDLRLQDQARIVAAYFDDDDRAEVITALRRPVVTASSVRDILVAEGQAADHYFRAWEQNVELRFAAGDGRRIGDHWRRFPGRRSMLSARGWSNRHATCPANALLNLGMKLCEIEATTSCLALGLDPSLGVLHADRASRPSLTLDLMETARGVVEETVLQLVETRTFRKAHFTEGANGEIRVRAPLSHELIEVLCPILADRLAPTAERMAAMIATAAQGEVSIPTVLSSERKGKTAKPRTARFRTTCHRCGGTLPPGRSAYSDDCFPLARTERGLSEVGPAPRRKKRTRIAEAYGSTADYQRAETMAQLRAQEQEWERAHQGMRRPSRDEFEPIRAALAGMPLARIEGAIGVSRTAASKIRSGQLVPHVRHWEVLAKLAGAGFEVDRRAGGYADGTGA